MIFCFLKRNLNSDIPFVVKCVSIGVGTLNLHTVMNKMLYSMKTFNSWYDRRRETVFFMHNLPWSISTFVSQNRNYQIIGQNPVPCCSYLTIF